MFVIFALVAFVLALAIVGFAVAKKFRSSNQEQARIGESSLDTGECLLRLQVMGYSRVVIHDNQSAEAPPGDLAVVHNVLDLMPLYAKMSRICNISRQNFITNLLTSD